ncbi:male gamete fusion factor HAP2, putative (HAP2) [Plasmodium ovale wallikeri]|uniref:Male gamete fusion factor HAP2, putative n=2 Tax=Plasmodium ovale TaxID=36330 RepID=A0A1C3KGX6_PLAOA|nr:male gamete fusion factor HAP2, putative (HAP2) [Plasmodium ovale wallikeri]SBT34647.1 male gamete fusion factor HAP2, putative (HAP2) [Plasmodium ovale wallikeri]SBT72940.1 male gamete fusion factor HAP2, putative [Plasmodium ovale]
MKRVKVKQIFKFLIWISYYIILKSYKPDDDERGASFIQLAYSFAKKKVCTSTSDDSTCREVVFGELDVSNNSVLRLKVLRPGGKGYFITIRRDYVTVSYYLKYMKNIPFQYREVVDVFNNQKFEKYSERDIQEYTYKCNIRRIEDIDKVVGNFPPYFLEYMKGESCTCQSYNLFKDNKSVKRSQLKCVYFNMLFTQSATVYSRHCAIMDLQHYAVYDIEYPPIFNTFVDITLQEYTYDDVSGILTNKHDLVIKEKKYELNDTITEIRDDYFDVWLFLRSETHGKRTLVNLSNDYILMPSSPIDNDNVIASDVTRNCGLSKDSPLLKGCDYTGICDTIHPCLRKALMLPKYLFDLSGKTCNKLGVSLNTWRISDGNFCASEPGHCISNNLKKYYDEHKVAMRENLASKYKIKNIYASEPQTKVYKAGELPDYLKEKINNNKKVDVNDLDNKIFYNENLATHSQFIDYKYNGNHSVEIKFETNALEVHEIRPLSIATITHITTPNECSSDVQNSNECILIVHVWNNSKNVGSNFSCSIECTDKESGKIASHISPISPIRAFIDSNKNYAFYFTIRFLLNKKFVTKCKAVIKDAGGRECSKEDFELTSKETVHTVGSSEVVTAPEASLVKYDGENSPDDSTNPTCKCTIDLLCYVLNFQKCNAYYLKLIKDFIRKFAIIVILILLAPALIPLFPFLVKFFFSCLSVLIKLYKSFLITIQDMQMRIRAHALAKQKKGEKLQKRRVSSSSSSSIIDTSSSSSSDHTMVGKNSSTYSKRLTKNRGYSQTSKKKKSQITRNRNFSRCSRSSLGSTVTYSTHSSSSVN